MDALLVGELQRPAREELVLANGEFQTSLMPVIRPPNFVDRTGDVPADRFFIRVGNERDGSLKTVPLTDVLRNIKSFASRPESIVGDGNMLAARDSHFLVSAQAVFLAFSAFRRRHSFTCRSRPVLADLPQPHVVSPLAVHPRRMPSQAAQMLPVAIRPVRSCPRATASSAAQPARHPRSL